MSEQEHRSIDLVKSEKIKVMIVDDSLIILSIVKSLLKHDEKIEVVCECTNGQDAINKMRIYKPDVVTLDVEMPVMNGLEAIPKLLEIDPKVKILMLSTLTKGNAPTTLKSLELGAADFLEKPNAGVSNTEFRDKIIDLVKSLGLAKKRIRVAENSLQVIKEDELKLVSDKPFIIAPEIVAVASSTGGPRALIEFFEGFSREYLEKKIVFVTQHMPPNFTKLLAKDIDKIGVANCKEGENNELIKPGYIYVAPGGSHMLVSDRGDHKVITLTQGEPENFCRPSADPMLRSLVQEYKKFVFIVLTGMGKDGFNGAKEVLKSGGIVAAQDEDSSTIWGMPGAVATEGLCTILAPPKELAKYTMGKG